MNDAVAISKDLSKIEKKLKQIPENHKKVEIRKELAAKSKEFTDAQEVLKEDLKTLFSGNYLYQIV